MTDIQGLKILVLDDDETRLVAFRKKFIGNAVTCVKTASEAINELSKIEYDACFLDHDLGDKVFQDSGPGTGYEVAIWISEHPNNKPQMVIIHSFNPVGARNMQAFIPGSILLPGAWIIKEESKPSSKET